MYSRDRGDRQIQRERRYQTRLLVEHLTVVRYGSAFVTSKSKVPGVAIASYSRQTERDMDDPIMILSRVSIDWEEYSSEREALNIENLEL